MDGNNQNNQYGQYNQEQYGNNQYYGGQPNVNQNNQFGQPGMNQYNQYGQGQMNPNQPQMGYQQPLGGYQWNYPQMTKKEFFKNGATSGTKGNIIAAAVMMYISLVVTLLVMFVMYGNMGAILDCSLLITLGLCVHLLQSRIAAVLSLAYGIFNVVVMYMVTGELNGWLILVAGICACVGTFKLEKEYQQTINRR